MTEEYDPRYMLSQIERLQWENTNLRRILIVTGIDMDKVNEMIGLDAWVKEKLKRQGEIKA